MKVVHFCLSPFNDNWGYQDNLLTKYQSKLGHDIVIFTTNTKHSENGIEEIDESEYYLDDGVKIVRKKNKFGNSFLLKEFKYYKVKQFLEAEEPDVIMIHGLVTTITGQVVKYIEKKNVNCKLILDNHLDDTIFPLNKTIQARLFVMFFKYYNKLYQKKYDRVYGVTPWRVDFARDVFDIKKEKLGLLLMGADDEKINFDQYDEIRLAIRKKYNIFDTDFVFVTGGKLERNKKIIETIKSFSRLKCKNVKLLVFGTIHKDVKEEFDVLLQMDKRIIYIGFIKSDEMYDYFFASDCAVFAGQHSVIWEQAVAAGIPVIFRKYVDGYVDICD
ncbi:MAG: glycosyltransferase family 4 protein [Culicoidibacterales bacterium]